MPFTRFVGCVLRGPEADLPAHASYWTDWKYEATEGNVYHNNGSAWVLTQGAAKSETLKNKILNFDQNTVSGVLRDPFSQNKRIGYLIPAPTPEASLNLALKGLPSVGNYSLFNDPVEGYVSRFSTSIIEEMGWQSLITPIITRRDYNPRFKIKVKSSVINSVNMWLGFSNAAITLANEPVPTGSHSAIVGMGSGFSANYYSIRNDGTADGGAHGNLIAPRDTAWNTFEIIMSATDIVFKLNATTLTFTTRLPGINTDLMLFIHYWSRDTTPKTFDVARAYFETDVS